MEYITVTYSGAQRDVYIDGDLSGSTGETLRVDKGTHVINLGDPRNYTPKWRRPYVADTSPIAPLEVTFERA